MTEDGGGPEAHRTVRLNDLIVTAGYEDVLRANKLDSLEAVFVASGGESLTKPGLSPWRDRIRLTLTFDDPPDEPRAFPARRDVGSSPPEPRVSPARRDANARTQRTVYLKRFTDPPREASREVRRSRTGASTVAGVEWALLNRLASEGIACPRPIAVGEELTGSRELRSALLSEGVPGRSLERWMSERDTPDRPMIRRLIGPTADFVARFHGRGYIHRDLYLSHLFFDPDATPERSLHLIDLARVIHPPRGRLRWIVKDLAALNFSTPVHLVSNTDRLRWLKRYLRVSKLDRSGRRLVYRVIGKTASIARHERRRQARFRSRSES